MVKYTTPLKQAPTSLFFSLPLIIAIALTYVGACSNNITDSNEIEFETIEIDEWSEITHGSSVEPNYDEIFSDGIVRRIDIVINSNNWNVMQDDMVANYGTFGTGGHTPPGSDSDVDPVWVPCDLYYNNIQWYQIGIRYKGNSSLRSAWQMGIGKLSFKLDFDQFEDQYPQITDQRFYGFKQLNLGNGYDDNSLIRERATAEIFRDAGIPAASTSFCRVYVDYGNGPVYFGLYTIVEEVDDTVIDDQFDNDDGNLYKPEGTGATFAFGTFNQSDFEKKSNELTSDWSDITQLFAVLHSSTRTSDPSAWRIALDSILYVDEFLHWLAVNTVIQNWDTYGVMSHNYYLYNDPGGNHLTWIPWDNNEALQEGKMGGALSLSLNEVSASWPLISYLLDDSEYRARYNYYVQNTIEAVFEPTKMIAKYQAWHNLIEPYVTGDDGEIPGYTFLSNPSDFNSELNYLISHVASRQSAAASYLSTQ